MTDTADLDALDAHLRTAMNLHRSGDLDAAEAAYMDLADIHPARSDILFLAGTIACQQGRWGDGVDRFQQVIEIRPDHARAFNNLASALQNLDRADEAADAYAQALALEPDFGEASYNFGTLLQAQGRPAEALDRYRDALVHFPGNALVLNNIGSALLQLGRHVEAAEALVSALDASPDYPEALNNLGSAHAAADEHVAAAAAFEKAIALRPNYPEALINLGLAYEKLDRQEDAVAAYERALALDPGNHSARTRMRQALTRIVPAWHFPMMNDTIRNEAYERAIRNQVRDDMHVLDIGTGAGLLAMMSARTGARRVTTCEMVKPIAACAAEIMDRNGLSGRVTVVPKKSNDVVVGADMPEQADLLVSEILSSDLLGEGVIPSVEDARVRLLKPGARMIPCAGSIRAFLAGGEDLESRVFVDEVSGFDVGPFNRFAPSRFSIRRQNYPYHAYSDDITIFAFDFEKQGNFPAERRIIRVPVTRSGRCQGVVQWIHLQLDDRTEFENHPNVANPSSGWAHLFHSFPEPVDLKAGQTVRLFAEHDRVNLFLTLDGVE